MFPRSKIKFPRRYLKKGKSSRMATLECYYHDMMVEVRSIKRDCANISIYYYSFCFTCISQLSFSSITVDSRFGDLVTNPTSYCWPFNHHCNFDVVLTAKASLNRQSTVVHYCYGCCCLLLLCLRPKITASMIYSITRLVRRCCLPLLALLFHGSRTSQRTNWHNSGLAR